MNRRTIRILALAAATVCWLWGASPVASAGTFEVKSCAAADGIDDAWVSETSNPLAYSTGNSCRSSTGSDLDGLVVADRLLGGDTALGTSAAWRLDAPPGAAIARVSLWRWVG